MVENRTTKTIRNTIYSFGYKISDVLFNFLLRTVFIKNLGLSFLGVSSLFTNILSILSLMDLGISSAIVFALYKPLAEGNKEKIASLMQLYKKVYTIIGILIALVGVTLTPFLPYIITLPEDIEHIRVIFCLYIANSSVSYFLAYRRTLLIADQKSYINTKNLFFFRSTRFVVLTITLFISKNFLAYLIVDVINTFISNIHITYVVRKKYGYLSVSKVKPLEKQEKKNILKYISSGIVTKIGQTVVTSTDSVIISTFISTISVGLYANYNMVFTGLDTIIYLMFTNLTASVGSYVVDKTASESENLFSKIFFLNFTITCVSAVCMICLLTPFIELWLGKSYLLHESTVLVIVLNYYLTSMCNVTGVFLGAVGELYYRNRYRALIEAIVNLTTSVIFVKVLDFGINGVFLGTTVCFVCGRVWMDPYTIYKNWFQIPFGRYVKTYICRFGLFLLLSLGCRELSRYVFNVFEITIVSWILVGVICIAICAGVIVLIYYKTEEFKYFISLFDKITKKHTRIY